MKKAILLIVLICTSAMLLLGCYGAGGVDNKDKKISVTAPDTKADVFLNIDHVNYEGDSPTLIVRWHNTTRYKVAFGERYAIERLVGDEWIDVGVKDKPFIEIGLMIEEHSFYEKSYHTDWVDLSKNGTYRLRTSYTLHHDDPDNYKTEDIFIEFIVSDR